MRLRCGATLIVLGAMVAWPTLAADHAAELQNWIASLSAGAPGGRAAVPVIQRLLFVSPVVAGAPPRAIDAPASMGSPDGIETASANKVNFAIKLNDFGRSMERAQILRFLGHAAVADLVVEVSDKGAWHVNGASGSESRDCAANDNEDQAQGDGGRPRWVRCIGYDAVVMETRGDVFLARSYIAPPPNATQGLLLEGDKSRLLPDDTAAGEGVVQVMESSGAYVLLKQVTERDTQVKPGVKVVFESRLARKSSDYFKGVVDKPK